MELFRKKPALDTEGFLKCCTTGNHRFPPVFFLFLTMVLSTLVSCKKEKEQIPSQFNKAFGGTKDDWFSAIAKSPDGGYVVSGFSNSFNGNLGAKGGNDIWIYKIDKGGNKAWEHIIGGSADEDGRSIIATHDGGI